MPADVALAGDAERMKGSGMHPLLAIGSVVGFFVGVLVLAQTTDAAREFFGDEYGLTVGEVGIAVLVAWTFAHYKIRDAHFRACLRWAVGGLLLVFLSWQMTPSETIGRATRLRDEAEQQLYSYEQLFLSQQDRIGIVDDALSSPKHDRLMRLVESRRASLKALELLPRRPGLDRWTSLSTWAVFGVWGAAFLIVGFAHLVLGIRARQSEA